MLAGNVEGYRTAFSPYCFAGVRASAESAVWGAALIPSLKPAHPQSFLGEDIRMLTIGGEFENAYQG